MRLVRNPNVATYIKREMPNLIPFSKDVCLLINDFLAGGVDGFDGISQQVTDLIVSERARPLEWCRAWFMDLGVRGSVTFSGADLRRLETLSGTLDVRQLHLLKWRACDRNFFRMRKTRVHELQAWAQPTFIFGARCLPREEYGHWIRGIKSRLQFPLGAEFADWCLRTYDEDPFVEPPAAT